MLKVDILGMHERTTNILLAAVDEFIKSGEPVSSGSLYEDYEFGIKPASIRSELSDLEREGWLSKPHTSGGRIPTDKAFEFFAKRAMRDIKVNHKPDKNFLALAELFIEKEFKDFVSGFADEVRLLSVGFAEDEQESYKSGLDDLFHEINAATPRAFYEIVKDLEIMEQRISDLLCGYGADDAGPKVFIGKKSPLIKSDLITTVFDVFDNGSSKVFFAAFGPKRMNYRKNIGAFVNLRKAIER